MFFGDKYAFRLARALTDGWYWLTGKSNFELARILTWFYPIPLVLWVAQSLREDGATWFTWILLIYVLVIYDDLRRIKHLEKKAFAEDYDGALPVWWLAELKDTRFERSIFLIIAIVQLPGIAIGRREGLYAFLFFLARGLSLYIRLCIDLGGGKSVLARAKEKVQARSLVPALNPTS